MKKTEHIEQREFVQWFKRTYPDYMIFAIPNGGGRTPAEGQRLKLEGVQAGVPDLQILLPNGKALFIEMKTKTGTLSASQRELIPKIESLGFKVFVCYGMEDAVSKVGAELKNLF